MAGSLARPKVTIVGAGMVGGAAAQFLALRDYADIVLLDIVEGLPQGKALDLMEAGPVLGYDTQITGTNSYAETAGSDVVVVTSGIARKPGMSRDDLLRTNMGIVRSVVSQVVAQSPDAILIIVSNPLDAMCHVALHESGFPANRVIGQAGALDTARYKAFIAMELGVSVRDIHGIVLGGHGDDMVPLPRHTSVAGIPVRELIAEDKLQAIIERTRKGGGEIVGLVGVSAWYAPAAGTVEMVEAILRDQKRVIPSAVLLNGEYGYNGLYVGVPVVLGAKGAEKVIEMQLNDDEKAMLAKSAASVQSVVGVLGY